MISKQKSFPRKWFIHLRSGSYWYRIITKLTLLHMSSRHKAAQPVSAAAKSFYQKILRHTALGKKSPDRHFGYIFLFFPRKQFWHFIQIVSIWDNMHEMSILFLLEKKRIFFLFSPGNRFWHFMQKSSFHEMSNHVFLKHGKKRWHSSFFLGKNKKNIINLSFAELAHSGKRCWISS